jgi:NADH:ubiquinone oxidoreductase subunit K
MIPLTHYLVLAAILFCIGLYGVLTRRNAIAILMSIELMLNAVNINLIAFNKYIVVTNPDVIYNGQIFAIFVLTVAAAEAAVGLALVLALYRNFSDIFIEKINILKW